LAQDNFIEEAFGYKKMLSSKNVARLLHHLARILG